ncbi:Uromodulin-like 1 [Saguinus oedipus]|uniref:Uromodulin-like 1 n=1 Tax=Saguinus oedipus TaxID=9490 RepID=A0ABQ9TZJ0_SAGOE|nr:Uromodulin-like 1 [Saguinus oedipus]
MSMAKRHVVNVMGPGSREPSVTLMDGDGPYAQEPGSEKGLSLLGYQLCSHRVTHTEQKVEAVQTSYTTYVSCGGWIPWRQCPKTVYRTRYLVVEVPESRNVTDCCEGYEQLGLYCVLRESTATGLGRGHPHHGDS